MTKQYVIITNVSQIQSYQSLLSLGLYSWFRVPVYAVTQLRNSCSFKTLLSPFSLTSKNSPKYSRYYLFWHSSTIMDFFFKNPCMWVSINRLYCISKFCVYSFDDSFNGPCHSSSEKLEGQNKFHFHLGCVQNGH